MTFYENVKSILLNKIEDMAQTPWLFANNPHVDFTRKRKMDFETLIRSVISMESGSVKHELLKFFDFDHDTLSPSAFHQQRRKLLPEAFPYLFRQFTSPELFTVPQTRSKKRCFRGIRSTIVQSDQSPPIFGHGDAQKRAQQARKR